MLGNTSQSGLMVRSGVDREHPVHASGETLVEGSTESAITVKRSIETLEESELCGVKRLRIVEAPQLLNDQVRMSNEDTVSVDLSGSGVVGQLSVGECASLEVLELEFGGEGLVCWDLAKVKGEDEFGGRNLVLGDDASLGDGVARAGADLLAVGEGNVRLGQAEVDKVVPACQGLDLASNWWVLTVLVEAIFNDAGVERR
jgi:hypothetical protein